MRIILLLSMFCSIMCHGQSQFELERGKKETVDFISSASLIIVPARVNGVELNFILDTGSARSVIFDFAGIDSLNIKKGRVVKYKGMGSEDFFEAYYSPNNIIEVGDHIVNTDAEVLIMVNQEFNLTERLGVTINGIIGADFFKNLLVEIDYSKQEVTVYKHGSKLPRRLNRYRKEPMEFILNKPYIEAQISHNNSEMTGILLLDTGSSDALWLHQVDSTSFNFPKKGFDDYLGFGLTGELHGRRSKIDRVGISDYELNRPTISFPNRKEYEELESSREGNGSIGGEILRRFDILFDYKSNEVGFIANRAMDEGFYYNMAGLSLKNDGIDIDLSLSYKTNKKLDNKYTNIKSQVTISMQTVLVYKKLPKIIVASVQKKSPAYKNGMRKGDQIVRVNNLYGEDLTLYKATQYFFKNPYSNLKITYKRDNVEYETKFQLVPLID